MRGGKGNLKEGGNDERNIRVNERERRRGEDNMIIMERWIEKGVGKKEESGLLMRK